MAAEVSGHCGQMYLIDEALLTKIENKIHENYRGDLFIQIRARPAQQAPAAPSLDAFAVDDFGDLFDKLINYFRNADEDADADSDGPRRLDWSFKDIERTIKAFRKDVRKQPQQQPPDALAELDEFCEARETGYVLHLEDDAAGSLSHGFARVRLDELKTVREKIAALRQERQEGK